jgi:tRNA 2-thiouridine synthesizing protein A
LDGDELEVLCSDPGALHDIPAWCLIHGHKLGHAGHREDGVIAIQVVACKA